MMQTRVVSDNGLKSTPSGFTIDVRLPWYRSLPLSAVELKRIELDRQPIDLGNVEFEINGNRLKPGELRPRNREMWFVLDSALLHVRHSALPKGSSHDVAVTLAVSPPYIRRYTRITRTQKTLVAQ